MERKSIGAFIASQRKSKGMTQKQLAQMLNVSDKAISRWERDEAQPDLTLIPVISDIFGVSTDELLRGSRSTSPTKSEKISDRGKMYGEARTIITIALALAGFLSALIFAYSHPTNYFRESHRMLAFLLASGFYLTAGTIHTISALQDSNNKNAKTHGRTAGTMLNIYAILISFLAGTAPILRTDIGLTEILFFGPAIAIPLVCILVRLNWFITKPIIAARTILFQAETHNIPLRELRKRTLFRDILICGILLLMIWTDQSPNLDTFVFIILMIMELPISTLIYCYQKNELK